MLLGASVENNKSLNSDITHLLPLDFDFYDNEAILVKTCHQELNSRLRLSALDFPPDRLIATPIAEFNEAADNLDCSRNINFLFHLPFSGSTFLTRFLEVDGITLYREPACIDALFQTVKASDPPELEKLRLSVLRFLSREDSGVVWVRTAGYRPEMYGPLTIGPHCSSALLLYEDLETFSVQVLKDSRRRRDLKIVMQKQADYFYRNWKINLQDLAIPQYISLFWLDAIKRFCNLPVKRKCVLKSKVLFNDTLATITRLKNLNGFEFCSPPKTSGVFNKHSKTGKKFDKVTRNNEIKINMEAYAEEIQSATDFMFRFFESDLTNQLERLELR